MNPNTSGGGCLQLQLLCFSWLLLAVDQRHLETGHASSAPSVLQTLRPPAFPVHLPFTALSSSLLALCVADVGKEFSINQPITDSVCASHHGRNLGGKQAILSLPIGREKQGTGDALQVRAAYTLIRLCISEQVFRLEPRCGCAKGSLP